MMNSSDHRHDRMKIPPALALIMTLMVTILPGLATGDELTAKINWSVWTNETLASPEGQRVNDLQSEKLLAQWLASKVTREMNALGIVPTTGVFDILGNMALSRGSGACGDVYIIFEDVFKTASLGQYMQIVAHVSEDRDGQFQSIGDPFGCNVEHGVLALTLDGEVYVFDPWMDSFSQSLLSGERWSYGHFQSDSKWNAMPVAHWWDSMQEAGYTRFWVGNAVKGGVSSQQHTNQISGAADINAACAAFIEDKPHQQTSAVSDPGSWIGTWKIKSTHETGPAEGKRYDSQIEIIATRDGNQVIWGKKKWICEISGNTLKFNGTHPSGGAMNWVFVRKGHTLISNQSTFKGKINGKDAEGTYEGQKQ